ncbi:MAG: ABC transporter ATP-binding protein [Anaerolineae bacterium]|nr:ABC transporter ATP-binding protein [Anaerolineae bacterium]
MEAENLTRRFKKIVAVDGLDLKVRAGEIFGLVGPDGAGKTTTMRMLCAIMDPTAGSARVAGFDTRAHPEQIKARIGYMAQRFNLYGDLTVDENLNFFADVFQVRGRERRERKERLLHFARLTRFRKRRAAHLSGGMQKKLALACTLIHEPQVIFLDEPTTGVDPVSRREFWDILAELHLHGITIFVTTPYMDEAERCSRVGLMYQGRIVVCDAPEKVKRLVEGDLIELRPVDAAAAGGDLIGAGAGREGAPGRSLRRAQQLLALADGVIEVQTYGDLLHIFVDDAGIRQAALVAALAAEGLEAADVRLTRPRMEEAFISLVRREMAAREAGAREAGAKEAGAKEAGDG